MKNLLEKRQKLSSELVNVGMFEPKRLVFPYTWAGHLPFVTYIVALLEPEKVVELGTHSGNSFNMFCQAVEHLSLNTTCVAIDCWEGDEQAGFYEDNVYTDLLEYSISNYPDIAVLKKAYFDDAVVDFENTSIDLLHIDGLHTYEAVKQDFENWLPKISKKGIVLFHDTQVTERNFGVYKLWDELNKEYTGFEFTHSHGLGVLIVGSNVPEKLLSFINYAQTDSEWVRNIFFSTACLMLPEEAKLYMMGLEIDSKKKKNDKLIIVELFESMDLSFSENKKQFKHFTLPKKISDRHVDMSFNLDKETNFIRLDPSHEAVLISEDIVGIAYSEENKESEGQLMLVDSNALDGVDNKVLFPNDPQMVFELPKNTSKVRFIFNIALIEEELEDLIPLRYQELKKKISEFSTELSEITLYIRKIFEELDLFHNIHDVGENWTIDSVLEKLDVLTIKVKSLSDEKSELERKVLNLEMHIRNLKNDKSLLVEKYINSGNILKRMYVNKRELDCRLQDMESIARSLYMDKLILSKKISSLSDKAKSIFEDKEIIIKRFHEMEGVTRKLYRDKIHLKKMNEEKSEEIVLLYSSLDEYSKSTVIKLARFFDFLNWTGKKAK